MIRQYFKIAVQRLYIHYKWCFALLCSKLRVHEFMVHRLKLSYLLKHSIEFSSAILCRLGISYDDVLLAVNVNLILQTAGGSKRAINSIKLN